jgi:hypothetical protein
MRNAECTIPGRDRPRVAKCPAPHAHSATPHLIPRAWHVNPLRCPVCQNPMRVIAVIDDPRVVEKILRHLGAWHDPPPRPSPQGLPGPYTYEPCDDVDPMPNSENVLTDSTLPLLSRRFTVGFARPRCCSGPLSARRPAQLPALAGNSSHHRPRLSKLPVDMPDRPLVISAPCWVSPKTKSPSCAQRSVRAGAQKVNSYVQPSVFDMLAGASPASAMDGWAE